MFEGLERVSSTSDWLTLFFLIDLILIAILQFNFTERFNKLFTLVYSEKYYTDYLKTRPLNFNWFHVIFFFIIVFNISIYVYFAFETLAPASSDHQLFFFFQILFLTISYFLIRYIIGFILGVIFDLEGSQNYFTFLKMSNLALLSIIILPLLILTNYSAGVYHKFLITFCLLASLAAALFRYFVLIKNEKLSFDSLFYLFLYLCALELAPFIVVYKLFVD
jgi:hypothetical protein